MKILADFISVIYLLNLVLKTRNKPYTTTLPASEKKPAAQIAHLAFANAQSQNTKNQKSNFLPTLNPNYGKNVTLRIE